MKKSQLYKGSLNTIILKLLSENGKMYGYEITKLVKVITAGEMNITEGALYPALHKLESEGVLSCEIVEVDHRQRKYYKLTDKGKLETKSKLAELSDFIQNMQNLILPKVTLDF